LLLSAVLRPRPAAPLRLAIDTSRAHGAQQQTRRTMRKINSIGEHIVPHVYNSLAKKA